MALTAEEALDRDVPLLFISFPSTKDPEWEKRYPGVSAGEGVPPGSDNETEVRSLCDGIVGWSKARVILRSF